MNCFENANKTSEFRCFPSNLCNIDLIENSSIQEGNLSLKYTRNITFMKVIQNGVVWFYIIHGFAYSDYYCDKDINSTIQ